MTFNNLNIYKVYHNKIKIKLFEVLLLSEQSMMLYKKEIFNMKI